jgi:hypothetical protein
MKTAKEIPDCWWPNATMLLSLDYCVAFYKLIGIESSEPIAWCEVMRSFIRTYRQNCERDSSYHSSQKADMIVDWIHKNHSKSSSQFFRWWVENLYAEGPRDHLALDYWTYVFREIRKNAAWDRLGLSTEKTQFVSRNFDASTRRDEFDEIVEKQDQLPLSDWDLHMHVLNQWNDDLLDAPNGPRSFLYPIAKAFAGYHFWNKVLGFLSAEEVSTMWRLAEEFLQQSSELKFIGKLEDPNSLRLVPP